MSWQATAWAEKQTTGRSARKALLLVLANYADEFGMCWPSQKTLAISTEQSVDSVQRQSRRLCEAGLLRLACRWPRPKNAWPSMVYFLAMQAVTEPQNAARDPSRKMRPAEPQNAARDPSRKMRPAEPQALRSTGPQALRLGGPQVMRHEPSLNSQIKPVVGGDARARGAHHPSEPSDELISWNSIKVELIRAIGADLTRSWFGQVTPGQFVDGELVLFAPSAFVVQRIERDFMDALRAACKLEYPSLDTVSIFAVGSVSAAE
jgi:hypothetical protein